MSEQYVDLEKLPAILNANHLENPWESPVPVSIS